MAFRSARPPASRGARSLLLRLLPEALLVLVVLGLALGPRVLEGRTALAWTRYHVEQGQAARRPGEHARQAGHWAAAAVDAAAPLPLAGEAARRALELGRAVEARDRAAALTLYTQVRAALERVRASRWRGLGLGGLAEEAGRLAQAARPPGP